MQKRFLTQLIAYGAPLLMCWQPVCSFADGQRSKKLAVVSQFVATYCLDCHGTNGPASKLDLGSASIATDGDGGIMDAVVWEKVVRRLRARQMPPIDADRPTESEFVSSLAALESLLDEAATTSIQPGRTDAIRRLNRTEYRNAIRDLLSVEIDVEDLLPADQSGHGFDNVTLSELPPILLTRYIRVAEQISRIAVGGSQRGPSGTIVRLPADRSQETHVDGLPFGTRGGTQFRHHFPATGTYEIQLRLMRDRDENVEGLNEPHDLDFLMDRALVHRFTVRPPKTAKGWQKDDTLVDAKLKKRFRATAGPHEVGVTFPRKISSLSEISRQPFDASFNRHRHPRRAPALYEVSIIGPFDPQGPGITPSRQQIFGRDLEFLPNPDASIDEQRIAARQILSRIIRLAYRRPTTDDDLVVPIRFFENRFRDDGFEAGIESALTTVLVNPHFLFRAESPPEGVASGAAYTVSNLELASRVSFFLWSSLPDDQLLDAAENDRLHEADVLSGHVKRMLADDRALSLTTNFAAQWLHLRNLNSFAPDRRQFPDFDDNLRQAMRRETELLFTDILRNDRSVLDLIRRDTAFLNERLAKHYGITSVLGSHFRPVAIGDAGMHRGGLLRNASVLAVTSYATRTSPTIRGNWILENILGTPAPPPPPNVPSLDDKKATTATTIRERLAEHRQDRACASCHDLMDPVGFAMEHYDAVGRWRDFDQGNPIDSTGRMPDGQILSGLADLEASLVARPDLFAVTMTEKLLTFALGRGVDPADGPAIRKVVREAADKDYTFSSLVLGIVSSRPFRMRIAE